MIDRRECVPVELAQRKLAHPTELRDQLRIRNREESVMVRIGWSDVNLLYEVREGRIGGDRGQKAVDLLRTPKAHAVQEIISAPRVPGLAGESAGAEGVVPESGVEFATACVEDKFTNLQR